MSFLHLYYTSAKTGINGGQGFQIYTMTPGITPQEQDEIIRLGMYNPPNQLPQMMEEEHIEDAYPKSLYFYPLKSGRFALGLSQYVGKDYSGRYGNYFSDTIVFDKEALKGKPIEYFQSLSFKSKLTQTEEESTAKPQPLPVEKDLQKGMEVDFLSVLQFLQQANRSDQLKKMISAVINYQQSKMRIVIVDEDQNIPYWIAAIQYVFTEECVFQLPFTTYTNDPLRQNALICGVYHKETPPSFWNQQFHVFDFIHNSYSDVVKSDYAETVVHLFLTNREDLAKFLTFIEMTGWKNLDIQLNQFIPLYKLIVQGSRFVNTDELRQAISIMSQLEDESGMVAIINILWDSWANDLEERNGFVLDVPRDCLEQITQCLFKVAQKSNKREHMTLAVSFFFQSWTQLLIDDKGSEHHMQTMAYYQQFMNMNKDNEYFSVLALNPERLEEIYTYCKVEKNEKLLTLFLSDYIQHVQRLNVDWDKFDKQKSYLLRMINLAVEQKFNLLEIYKIVSEVEEAFLRTAQLLMKAYCDFDNSVQAKYLINAVLKSVEEGKVDGELAFDFIHQNEYAKEIVIGIFKEKIHKETLPISTFLQLEKRLLSHAGKLRDMKISLLDRAVMKLLRITNTNEFLSEAQILWSNDSLLETLTSFNRSSLVGTIEKRLPFSDELKNYSNLLKRLAKEKEKECFNQQTSPDIVNLLLMLIELEQKHELPKKFLITLGEKSKGLSKEQVKSLLDWRFPLLTQLVDFKNNTDVVELLKAMHCYEHEELVFDAIINYFKKSGKQDKVTMLAAYCYSLVNHEKVFSKKHLAYFEQEKGLLKKVREGVSKLPESKKTDLYLEEFQLQISNQTEDSNSIIGKMKSLLKIKKHEE